MKVKVKCIKCDGDKRYYQKHIGAFGELCGDYYECEVCKGKGKIKVDLTPKQIKKIYKRLKD